MVKLPSRYRVISCVEVSKETLPRIRVSRLMPEGQGQCSRCGIEASHVVTYTMSSEDHLMVYSNIFAGSQMMTADHILPKSLGGRNKLTNLQLMCEHCNSTKGNIPSQEEIDRIKSDVGAHVRPSLGKKRVEHILSVCPQLEEVFANYFQLVITSDYEVGYDIARKPFMHAIHEYKPRLSRIKHPHHPLRGWLRILDQFPDLKSYVTIDTTLYKVKLEAC